MGRHPKSYEAQLQLVRDMTPGTTLIFKRKKPWGLTHKIYAMLREWKLEEYFNITTDKNAGEVAVRMKGGTTYIYEDN